MMSKKSPQLRFEGFTDDWEERKLSSGLREYTDRVIVEDDKEYYQISVRNNFGGITLRGSKMGNKIGRKRQAKINLTKYPQTLIFTRQTVEQGGIGWVDKYCDGAIVTENMPTISLDTSVFSKYFLTNLFQTRIFYKNAILDNIEGGSAQIAIHESKFLSSTLLFPNLDEQEKIGQFFKQLDDTIDLHQRKLDLLKEQKKGYLQKMFPKNGAKVPELRFAGFADDWEERKLVSMTNYKNGKGHEDKQSTIGKFELINLNSISISGGLKHSGKFIDEADDTLQKDDLVMILSDVGHGDLLGRVALIPEDDRFVLNQRVALLRPNATADPQFLFSYINAHQYYFKAHQYYFKAQGAGMSQLNISKGSVENFISFVPIIEEQKKIGTFFKQLDNTITLHQRKLDLLKEQKKGFLQKMFV
ncbi:restriction endonuclease subunit S [Lactococcus cremoris]|uniref:restriction endonuclease subunit S n=1 Tax=Lactococcus lactis subsp. cremoris TaxID=1359 RepID=UPI0024A66D05|nr:restriction endonuclease subunit S [Lactococcus cremoris]